MSDVPIPGIVWGWAFFVGFVSAFLVFVLTGVLWHLLRKREVQVWHDLGSPVFLWNHSMMHLKRTGTWIRKESRYLSDRGIRRVARVMRMFQIIAAVAATLVFLLTIILYAQGE